MQLMTRDSTKNFSLVFEAGLSIILCGCCNAAWSICVSRPLCRRTNANGHYKLITSRVG